MSAGATTLASASAHETREPTARAAAARIPLLYIASPSYSGSTLLTFLLNAHPQIATIGELKWGTINLENYQCSCGALLRECGFWKQVSARMKAEGLPFDLNRPMTSFRCLESPLSDRLVRARVRGPAFESVRRSAIAILPSCRRSWPVIRRVNSALMRIILDISGGMVFLDGSKDPTRLQHLHESGDYDLRIIQLVRDGRGVTNSCIKHGEGSPRHCVDEWLRTHQQIELLGRRIGPDRLLRVHYEKLCAAPKEELARIIPFAGLSADDMPADYRAIDHHILGNQMRLRSADPIVVDEKWRKELAPTDLAVFERLAGQTNRRMGYE